METDPRAATWERHPPWQYQSLVIEVLLLHEWRRVALINLCCNFCYYLRVGSFLPLSSHFTLSRQPVFIGFGRESQCPQCVWWNAPTTLHRITQFSFISLISRLDWFSVLKSVWVWVVVVESHKQESSHGWYVPRLLHWCVIYVCSFWQFLLFICVNWWKVHLSAAVTVWFSHIVYTFYTRDDFFLYYTCLYVEICWDINWHRLFDV